MTQTAASALTVLGLPGGERNLIGLAGVSTDAQDARLQQDALALAACGRVYAEKVSTHKAATERPGLAAALGYLRCGDTLVVRKLDRLGRSVKEVLTIAGDLHARGGQGAPGPRREPRQDRQGPRCQPRLDLPAPGR